MTGDRLFVLDVQNVSVSHGDQLALTNLIFNVTAVRSIRVMRDDHNDDTGMSGVVGVLENESDIDAKYQRAFSIMPNVTGNFLTTTQALTTLTSCNATEMEFNLSPGPPPATLRRFEPSNALLRAIGPVGCAPMRAYGFLEVSE